MKSLAERINCAVCDSRKYGSERHVALHPDQLQEALDLLADHAIDRGLDYESVHTAATVSFWAYPHLSGDTETPAFHIHLAAEE